MPRRSRRTAPVADHVPRRRGQTIRPVRALIPIAVEVRRRAGAASRLPPWPHRPRRPAIESRSSSETMIRVGDAGSRTTRSETGATRFSTRTRVRRRGGPARSRPAACAAQRYTEDAERNPVARDPDPDRSLFDRLPARLFESRVCDDRIALATIGLLSSCGVGRRDGPASSAPVGRYPLAAAQGVDPQALERACATLSANRDVRCLLVIRSLDQTIGEFLDPVVPGIPRDTARISIQQLLTMTRRRQLPRTPDRSRRRGARVDLRAPRHRQRAALVPGLRLSLVGRPRRAHRPRLLLRDRLGGQFLVNVPARNATVAAAARWSGVADPGENWTLVWRTIVETGAARPALRLSRPTATR